MNQHTHASPEVVISRTPLTLGKICATPAAIQTLNRANVSLFLLINRHASHDWGDISPADWARNDLALESGRRVQSRYLLPENKNVWIFTESDRSVTTVMLPGEY
jgi:hypothetical protein